MTRSREHLLMDVFWETEETERKLEMAKELLKEHPEMDYIEICREAKKLGIIKADYLK